MKFKYKAYNDLLIDLGRLDYVVEIVELSIREFLSNLNDSKNPEMYLRNKSNKYNIMVSYDDSNTYYNQITLANISNVYHLVEKFFYEMKTEYNLLSSGSEFNFTQGSTKLNQVISFLSNKNRLNRIDKIDQYLIDTFEYYHQLRVVFSHKTTTSESETNKKREKAIKHYNNDLLKKYRITEAPKKIEYLNFEDYFLFTQISKEIALQISSLGYPDPKNLAKIPEIIRLKKLRDNNVRFIKAIKSYLITEYGYVKENESDNIVEQISSFL